MSRVSIQFSVSGVEDVIGHHGRHWWMHKLTEFNDIQNKELETKKQGFKDSFDKIRQLLIQTYKELFMDHEAPVQREWINTMRELDKSLEKSLKASVKSTLLDFQHHIKGDQ